MSGHVCPKLLVTYGWKGFVLYKISLYNDVGADNSNAFRIEISTPAGKKPLGRPRRRW